MTTAGAVDVLVVGGGAREHAIAWAIAQSPRCGRLFVAPGNDATPGQRVPIAADDVEALTSFAAETQIDLVIVGPEIALAAGLVDALSAAGIDAFGPTR
ncbi:MAG: phosphoribosylamine--glycine ligase N-terminal domain-containing protein, partial [Ilumatobacteraceae bacterium]